METKCLNCGRTLTTERGRRVRSASFDSALPTTWSQDNTTVWARCDECIATARHVLRKKLRRERVMWPDELRDCSSCGAINVPSAKCCIACGRYLWTARRHLAPNM